MDKLDKKGTDMQSSLTTNSECFQIITGHITNLEVYDAVESFTHARKLAGCSDLNLYMIGHLSLVFTANKRLAMYATRNELDCPTSDIEQYFRFKLGNNIIEGVCCRVAFAEGDYVEVVVDQIAGGTYFAYALRRPIDHLLWLHPYATEGTEAKLNEPSIHTPLIVKVIGLIAILSGIFGVIQAYLKSSWVPLLLVFFGAMLLIPLKIFYGLKKEINAGSAIADRIFTTLGYNNPKQFDIEKEHYLFFNKLEQLSQDYLVAYQGPLTEGEDIVQEFIDQYKNQQSADDTEIDKLVKHYLKLHKDDMRWVYLYRHAPSIPNYITVINT